MNKLGTLEELDRMMDINKTSLAILEQQQAILLKKQTQQALIKKASSDSERIELRKRLSVLDGQYTFLSDRYNEINK